MSDSIQTDAPTTEPVIDASPATTVATEPVKTEVKVDLPTRQDDAPKDPDADFNKILAEKYGKKEEPSKTPAVEPEPKAKDEPSKPEEELEDDHVPEGQKPPETVPYTKLHHALKTRREALNKVKEAETALSQEKQIVDVIAKRYTQAGIPEDKILDFADAIAAAKRGHPGAIQYVTGLIGIQPPKPQTDGISVEEVESLIRNVQNAIDPEVVVNEWKSKRAKPPEQPTRQPEQHQPVQTQQPQRPAYDNNAVLDYATSQLDAIEQVEGEAFVTAILPKIQAAVQAQARDHIKIHGSLSTEAGKNLYRKVQSEVISAEKKKSAKPPTQIPSSSSQPINIDPSDPDRDFKQMQLRRYGRI